MSPLVRILSVFAAFTLTAMLAVAPLTPTAAASVSGQACSIADSSVAPGAMTGAIAA